MDSMEFNKIAGAVLVALLIAFGGSTLIHEMGGKHGYAKPGYDLAKFVDTSAVAATAPAAEEEKPIFEEVKALLASASSDDGKKVFSGCKACHTVAEGGANKIGPNLWNIVNRDIGGADGYKYSSAMAEKEGNWSFEELAGFLHKPKKWIPGTKMGYAGLKKPKDVAAVLVYLRELSASPAELPAATQ